jgi:hypothetical protein
MVSSSARGMPIKKNSLRSVNSVPLTQKAQHVFSLEVKGTLSSNRNGMLKFGKRDAESRKLMVKDYG